MNYKSIKGCKSCILGTRYEDHRSWRVECSVLGEQTATSKHLVEDPEEQEWFKPDRCPLPLCVVPELPYPDIPAFTMNSNDRDL